MKQLIYKQEFFDSWKFVSYEKQSMVIISQIINKKKHVNEKQKKAMNRARFSFIYSFVRCFINGQIL
jgi:hypothetical protein